MQKVCLFWLALAVSGNLLKAAEPTILNPLAYGSAPPCAQKPGIRALRSEMVEYRDVTASISAQAAKEGNSCVQSAALWVTQKGVSQQFDLRDAAANRFAIVDVAPDSSAILLSSETLFRQPELGQPKNRTELAKAQIGLISLGDGSSKWISVAAALGFRDCDATAEPQGFLDDRTVVIAVGLPRSGSGGAACVNKPAFYSVDIETRRAKLLAGYDGVSRQAKAVSGPLQSCKTDPDVAGACRTTRARLALSGKGDGMVVWTLGSAHYMAVEEQMVPEGLRSQVTPEMRVYATMVICPLTVPERRPRPYVCIDSAVDLKPDPVVAKNFRPEVRRGTAGASRF